MRHRRRPTRSDAPARKQPYRERHTDQQQQLVPPAVIHRLGHLVEPAQQRHHHEDAAAEEQEPGKTSLHAESRTTPSQRAARGNRYITAAMIRLMALNRMPDQARRPPWTLGMFSSGAS